MGPDLWELFEDGKGDDEVAAIIRLGHYAALPKGVRVITQFSEIITIRTTRANLPNLSGAPEVADIAAGDTYLGADIELETADSAELSSDTVLPTDERRPADVTATGRGVVIGAVDWGFDFAHPDFLNKDGTTRILALWDQRGSKRPNSPQLFGYGVVHDRAEINRALKQKDPYAALGYHPADADTGIGCHGTHVLSIAAGGGGSDRPTGIAPEADLVLVHNAPWDEVDSGRLGDSVTLLEGIDFIARTAGDRPWVINLSMGRHGEQHDGTTMCEQGLDAAIRTAPGRAICLSAGNYFDKRIHASGQLRPTQERTIVWDISEDKPTNNQLEFWYSWQDKFEITVRSPGGSIVGRAAIGERSKFLVGGKEVGNIYHRGQEPNNLDNHITVYLYKEAPAGEWELTLTGTDVIDGRYHAWIERDVSCPRCQSRLRPEDADPKSTTGTICNGRRTLAVGAYDRHDPEMRLGHFSSVGPTRDGRLKPDLCAPGVSVLAARSAPRIAREPVQWLTRMSGTSMAAPHVTGTVALMFQAAPRRLRIEETHNLLLQSTRKVSVPEDIPERIGIGFLDTAEAVEAAQKIRGATSSFKQTTVQTGSVAKPKLAGGEGAEEDVERLAGNMQEEAFEGRAEAEYEPSESSAYQNTFHRIASDITGAFEGGKPGTLNLYDLGVISYGKHQATLHSGTLFGILRRYTELSSSMTATKMGTYLERVKQRDETLREDAEFIRLLKDAAKESEMDQAQDEEFGRQYWEPAKNKAAKSNIKTALGHAIFYDTKIQGGLDQVAKSTEMKIGGVTGQTVNGKEISEQDTLRIFVEERIQRNLAISANQKKQAAVLYQAAQDLEDAAVTDPTREGELKRQAADKRKKAKEYAANAAALTVSSTKTRGPSFVSLVDSGDLDLLDGSAAKIYLKGKPGVTIASLRPGAAIDATTPAPTSSAMLTPSAPPALTASPHAEQSDPAQSNADSHTRQLSESVGRLVNDLLLLRLAVPPAPTIVTVQQPAKTASEPPPDEAAEDTGEIGGGRTRVTPTTDQPWRWMCQIEIYDSNHPDKPVEFGSGVLISDRHVLTAAHVVWDCYQASNRYQPQVWPGRDYDDEPFGSAGTSKVRVCPNYDPNNADHNQWDYALITLSKSVGKNTFASIGKKQLRFWGAPELGSRFTMSPSDPRTLSNSTGITAGYPRDKDYGRQLWSARGRLHSISLKGNPNLMFTTADQTKGQSGSPYWIAVGDQLCMVGVAIIAGSSMNQVLRVTPDMIDQLRTWFSQDKETPWMANPQVPAAQPPAASLPSRPPPAAPPQHQVITAAARAAEARAEAARLAGAQFAEMADQIVRDMEGGQAPVRVLHELFERSEDLDALATAADGGLPSSAQIFDSLVYVGNSKLSERLGGNFEVIALPGEKLGSVVCPGDVVIRRGDGKSAHVAIVASDGMRSLEQVAAEGLTTESRTPGNYVHVVEGGPYAHESEDKYARQLTDSLGRVLNDVVLLRLATPPSTVVVSQQAASLQEDPFASTQAEFVVESSEESITDNENYFDMTELPPVVSRHQMLLDGNLLNYTATAGRLPIKRGDGQIEAQMFFVAYTLDRQDSAQRPVTFAFNGGPGSASLWLHIGALGPRKVALQPGGFLPPAPYRIENNPYTLLDRSDLVLIDAIGTGFSRASDSVTFQKFWGVKSDIEAFSEFIRLYITRYERWGSPLFLLGESYGTLRAAGIAGYLAGKGISFNGITLLSTVLNYETLEATKTNDLPFTFLIPTFTMIAGYHHKLPPDLAQDMNRALKESEEWASGEYALALAKGDGLTSAQRQRVIDQMARLTGLTKQVIDDANLRIDVNKFTHNLLLDKKLRVGRFDGRFTGTDPEGLLDTQFYDPTEAATHPPFTSVFNNYLRTELGYRTDMPYYTRAQDADSDTWNWGSAIGGFPDTTTAIRQAIVRNSFLKILVMEGYYDLATPFSAANYTIDHLDLPPSYRSNISFAAYEAGHMVYLPEAGLKKMKEDQANFILQSSASISSSGFEAAEESAATAAAAEDNAAAVLAAATREMSLQGIGDNNLGQLPPDILAAILTHGENDASGLTDRVFWQNHLDLSGKKLDPQDHSPRAQTLRSEWSVIFRRRVQPMIWLRAMIDRLDKCRGTIPREFLLGWIAVESDGHFNLPPSEYGEIGYFQIMWQGGEAKEQLHITQEEFQKLRTDPLFSLDKGVALAQAYRHYILKSYPFISDGSDLLWRLTKARHAASGILKAALAKLEKNNTPITWASVSMVLPSWMLENIGRTMAYAAKLKPFADLVPASAASPVAPPGLDTETIDLGEDVGPLGPQTETFSAAGHYDHEEWADINIHNENIDSSHVWVETEIPDSGHFHPLALADAISQNWLRKTSSASDAPYELKWRAHFCYPKGKAVDTVDGTRALPVVILLHGNHEPLKPDGTELENHLGYSYLQQELARHGIISVSILTNLANRLNRLIRTRAEFVLAGLRILKKLNAQTKCRFFNRLDLGNIGLMGHSRGGDGVVKAAILNRGSSDFVIRAVCCLAPTDYSGPAANALQLFAEDKIRFFVLYGSHDSDVGGQDGPGVGTGFRHYDRATCERSMVFVKSIKHNRFNEQWKRDADYKDPFDCSPTDPGGLSVDLHHNLANEYIGGLFRLELNRDTTLRHLFDGSEAPRGGPPGGYTVSLQWSPPRKPRTILLPVRGTVLDKDVRWTKGWSTLVPLRMPGSSTPFELGYKISTGDAVIDRIDPVKGTFRLWKGTWRKGWTHFLPFHLTGDNHSYHLAYMGGTGEVAIDRISNDGMRVQPNIWKDTWSTGWTNFMSITLPKDDATYYLAYKAADGTVDIDRVKQPAEKGTGNIFTTTWTKGWTILMPFRLPDDERQCFLAYNKDSGEVAVNRIEADGKKLSELWNRSWNKGFTSLVSLRVPGDDRTYFFAYNKDDGAVVLGRIQRDGLATETILTDTWTAEWSHFLIFEVNGKPHMLSYKVDSGEVIIGRMLPDHMLEVEDFEDRGSVAYDPTKDLLGAKSSLTSLTRVDFQPVFSPAKPFAVQNQTRVLQGSAAGAKYRAEIPPANRSFAGFDLLTFRMASDFTIDTEEHVKAGKLPDFKVRLVFGKTSGTGEASAEVSQKSIDATGVRQRQKPFFRHFIKGGCVSGTKIVLQTLAIPLSKFAGVNWSDVRAVEFEAGPTVTADFYFDSLALMQS